jgi:Cd2+/Zn2+-exporting ATPase
MFDQKTINIPLSIRETGECFNCTTRLIDDIKRLKGIQQVEVAVEPCQLHIEYDPNFTSLEIIENFINRQGLRIKSHYDHRHYMIENLDCPDCAVKLEQRISKIEGVTWASLNFATSTVWFEYEPEAASLDTILTTIEKAGYTYREPDISRVTCETSVSIFKLAGIDCADCTAKLQKKLAHCDGVEHAEVNFAAATMTVKHDLSVINRSDIIRIVSESGYTATLHDTESKNIAAGFFHVKNRRLLLTLLSALFILCGALTTLFNRTLPLVSSEVTTRYFTLADIFYIFAIITGGYYAARSGFYTILAKTTDMNVLMTFAVIGAIAIGEVEEGAMVSFLFSLGNLLQSYTLDKTRNALRLLMDLAPREANLKTGGVLKKVPVTELRVNDVIVVKPGEKVPVDGVVTKGVSSVNESPITGESIPVDKIAGTMVLAGSINGPGVLEIKVEKRVEDSTLSRIIHLVEEAQAQKAPSQHFVENFSKFYTPAVIIGSLLVIIVPPLLMAQPFTEWFYRGLMLLVISCPCALVISTPVSIVSAISCASRHGILIKGGAYLEEMAKISAIAFDKTGTLTRSRLDVTDLIPLNGTAPRDILYAAACLEMVSEHPLAKAVLKKAATEDIKYKEPLEFVSFPGHGIKARMDGAWGFVGNLAFFADQGIPVSSFEPHVQRLECEGKTTILVSLGHIQGVLGVADAPRDEAVLCVRELKASGIKHISLISGDNERVVAAVAQSLGIEDYYAGMLPENKVEAVRNIVLRYGKTAMVGDGINDAPALASATIGIAMGVAGTDTAIETADIALMSDDLLKLPFLIHVARKTLATIKTNIYFSILVKAAFIMAVFLGVANLWMAVAADTGTSLLVTLNGMRLASIKSLPKGKSA